MSDNKLEKRMPATLAEKGQYALAFVVVAAMLLVAGFPTFVIFFFGIFAYFLWKIFTTGSRSETREIFEFYLSANEILRDDDRRWFGFEVRETIARGERVIHLMSAAPPLAHFTLGALYSKLGEHKEAVDHLSKVFETDASEELKMVFPSNELRNYVRVLRKIEREPAEAPLTSAAVRSLERSRRLRGPSLLEESRRRVMEMPVESKTAEERPRFELVGSNAEHDATHAHHDQNKRTDPRKPASITKPSKHSEKPSAEPYVNRKPISEVLHDIYDKNIQ